MSDTAAARRRPVDAQPEEPERDELETPGLTEHDRRVDRAALAPQAMTGEDVDALTDFFLGPNRARPGEGSDYVKKLAVNIARDETEKEPREMVFTVRAITFDEWETARRLGVVRERGEEHEDSYKIAAYAAAYAIVDPDLGTLRMKMPDADRPPTVAAMLEEFFRFQPGNLIQLQNRILRMSRLSMLSDSVREVDAAGN